MTAITNYTTLVNAVVDWTHRQDLSGVVDSFIDMAEKRMNADLTMRAMETTNTSLSTVAGTATVTLPTDFRELISLAITSTYLSRLDYVDRDTFTERYGLASTGLPRCFTLYGSQLTLGPTPDATYALTLVYVATIPQLSLANPTNWLIALAPDIYIAASMCYAMAYIKDYQGKQFWEGEYDTAVKRLNDMDWHNAGSVSIKAG